MLLLTVRDCCIDAKTINRGKRFIYASGFDAQKNTLNFIMDRLCMPTNEQCGYAHIVNVTRNGVSEKWEDIIFLMH